MVKWFKFIRLLNNIFRRDLPDLNKIQKQGLLAVKIGQTFALRIDFLGEEKCHHLAKLYSHTDEVSPEDIDLIIDEATPKGWRDHFEYIEKNPIGSASVGQVHRARLKTGENVVVKVIKDDFKKKFIKDVRSFKRFMKFIIFFYRKLSRVADPIGILEHIETYTLSELDLRNEIKHAKILNAIKERNQQHFNFEKLAFPRIHESLSSELVLVSEYIPGETVDDLIDTRRLSKPELLEIFHIHGFYIFIEGTFHGDIHPGNMIHHEGKFYFLDTGALSTVGEKIRRGLFEFMRHLSNYDFKSCAAALNRMAAKEISGKRFERFEAKMLDLYDDFEGATVSEVSLTRRMMETIKLGVHAGMTFEKGMFPIIKSMMYLDGIVLKGQPDMVLMEEMRQYIEEFDAAERQVAR